MIEITRDPIDTPRLLKSVTKPQCGAEVLFVGTTRQWTDGEETHCLEYQAYEPMALSEMENLASAARAEWDVEAIAISHRLGTVPIGEASVAVAVGAAHRRAAFAAAEWIMDQLKQSVPIWKREVAPDQTSHWVHPR